MQRNEADGVIISCDFCATDWDQIKPMVEGHHGSVLCLNCLTEAITSAAPDADEYSCTLCLREHLPPSLPRWSGKRPEATVCLDCLQQAAKAFDRDDDVDWKWER